MLFDKLVLETVRRNQNHLKHIKFPKRSKSLYPIVKSTRASSFNFNSSRRSSGGSLVDDHRRRIFWRLPASEDASRRGHPPDTQATTRGSRVGPGYRRRGQFASCSLLFRLKFATNLVSVGSSASIRSSASV
jgi:hypothetical protein